MKKTLHILLFLLPLLGNSQTISYIQDDETLKVFVVDGYATDFGLEPDSVKVVWKYTCVPFGLAVFHNVDTLGLGDTLNFPRQFVLGFTAEVYQYGEASLLGYVKTTSNTLWHDEGSDTTLEIDPSINGGSFSINLNTNAQSKYVTIVGVTYPSMVYAKWWGQNQNQEQVNMWTGNPNGLYQVNVRLVFDKQCPDKIYRRAQFLKQ